MATATAETLGTKTFDEIVNTTLRAIVDQDIGLTNVNEGSVVRSLVESLAENEFIENYYLEYIYKVMNINNCRGTDLDRAAIILGLTRNPATYATGEVTFYTGDSPADYDITIPYGYIVTTIPDYEGNAIEFSVISTDAVIEEGSYSVTATVQAVKAGLVNISQKMIRVLPESLQGVAYCLNNNDINGGEDTESDVDFLDRISNARETFGKCTDEAIKQAVEKVSGVANVTILDRYQGNGTTGVMVVTDQVPAPSSVVAEVLAVVNAVKASGVYPIIIYTNTKPIEVNITIEDISTSAYNTIVNAITAYSTSLEAGQTFIIKQMERKILNALDTTPTHDNDEEDLTTNLPESNITASSEQIIRVTKITINGTVVYGE